MGFLAHRARPEHDWRHPVHVTMRRVALAPSFRTQLIGAVILRELARAKAAGVRVTQYSIQDDHLHLMVEGEHAADLSAQMRKLFSRIAMMVNVVAHRRGSLFRDRHHRHALGTAREVRHALVYILFNARKHQRDHAAEAQALHDAPRPFQLCALVHELGERSATIAGSRCGVAARSPRRTADHALRDLARERRLEGIRPPSLRRIPEPPIATRSARPDRRPGPCRPRRVRCRHRESGRRQLGSCHPVGRAGARVLIRTPPAPPSRRL